jgi:hypothetical protein
VVKKVFQNELCVWDVHGPSWAPRGAAARAGCTGKTSRGDPAPRTGTYPGVQIILKDLLRLRFPDERVAPRPNCSDELIGGHRPCTVPAACFTGDGEHSPNLGGTGRGEAGYTGLADEFIFRFARIWHLGFIDTEIARCSCRFGGVS